MIWPRNKTGTDIGQAAAALSPFISVALSGLHKDELYDPGRTRTLAECYVYGAIRYLASYDDMRATSTGSLLKELIAQHFDANQNEVTECLEFCAAVDDSTMEKLFMMEGAGALRRWLVNNDRSVAGDLKSLIEKSN